MRHKRPRDAPLAVVLTPASHLINPRSSIAAANLRNDAAALLKHIPHFGIDDQIDKALTIAQFRVLQPVVLFPAAGAGITEQGNLLGITLVSPSSSVKQTP
jgi:hypothetical protein